MCANCLLLKFALHSAVSKQSAGLIYSKQDFEAGSCISILYNYKNHSKRFKAQRSVSPKDSSGATVILFKQNLYIKSILCVKMPTNLQYM